MACQNIDVLLLLLLLLVLLLFSAVAADVSAYGYMDMAVGYIELAIARVAGVAAGPVADVPADRLLIG